MIKKSEKKWKKRDFPKTRKTAKFAKSGTNGFGPKKRQKTLLIAPLANVEVQKPIVPRALFCIRRNGGVGGEQSGDFFFGLFLAKKRHFSDTPPPILGVDIDPGGVFDTRKSGKYFGRREKML